MRILQRFAGQSISIGKDIQIIILGHYHGATHIGVVAPPEIKIVRDEIKDKETKPIHSIPQFFTIKAA
jgi:carbon storage regulator CsrA